MIRVVTVKEDQAVLFHENRHRETKEALKACGIREQKK
jgi:hypothetical protein